MVLRVITWMLACLMLTGCISEGKETLGEKLPNSPVVRIVGKETREAPLKTFVRCWNEPSCTEQFIRDPEKAPITETKPGGHIRIIFSDLKPDDITILQTGPDLKIAFCLIGWMTGGALLRQNQ